MFEALSGFLSALKSASPQLLAAIAIGSAILLFAPPLLIATIGLTDLLKQYRGYIGGALIVSSSVVLVQAVSFLVSRLRQVILRRRNDKARLSSLGELTPAEKAYLLPYIAANENTQYYSVNDGVAEGLVTKGILYRPTSMGSLLEGFAYNMQPWARRHLMQNPSLLEGAGPRPATPRERLGITW